MMLRTTGGMQLKPGVIANQEAYASHLSMAIPAVLHNGSHHHVPVGSEAFQPWALMLTPGHLARNLQS